MKYIPKKTFSFSKLSVLHIPELNVTEKQIKKFQGCFNTKYHLDRSAIQSISNDMYWLSSDDINCYMEMLSANTIKDDHMVDAGWFSHKVIDSLSSTILKCDMFQLQSKSVNWFEKSHIVIQIKIEFEIFTGFY